jgi:hypothetical protein
VEGAVRRAALLALLPAALLALATGCETTHYDWGRYEDSVYAITSTPDGFDLQAEIDGLEQQLEKSMNHDRLPPPGLHAHLGYLHSVAGNLDAARQHFENEKRLYPESKKFMDALESRLAPHP